MYASLMEHVSLNSLPKKDINSEKSKTVDKAKIARSFYRNAIMNTLNSKKLGPEEDKFLSAR